MLFASDAWSLAFREKQKLRKLMNGIMRKISEP
jgi:hypothetical protein